MSKKLIIKISEGLGNQMFAYSNGLAISKKFNYDILLDNKSAYFKKKNIRQYNLDIFKITTKIASDKYIYNNFKKDLIKKFLLKLDKFKLNKKFYIEKKQKNKTTFYEDINLRNFNNNIYIEGHFESELYFKDIKKTLIEEFQLKNRYDYNNYSSFIEENKKKIVAITLRQNRFSERTGNINSVEAKIKSENFVKLQFNYINRSIKYFKSKIENPLFLIFSNISSNLENFFRKKDQYLKIINTDVCNQYKTEIDYNLLRMCQHHIVGPSTFHWWPAWLNYKNSKDTLVVRPIDLNPSNNKDFWPSDWYKI
jgi:hypothetical protein